MKAPSNPPTPPHSSLTPAWLNAHLGAFSDALLLSAVFVSAGVVARNEKLTDISLFGAAAGLALAGLILASAYREHRTKQPARLFRLGARLTPTWLQADMASFRGAALIAGLFWVQRYDASPHPTLRLICNVGSVAFTCFALFILAVAFRRRR